MTGVSYEAIEAARALLDERTGRYTNVELLREGFEAAYPIIRADVIAEVVAYLRDPGDASWSSADVERAADAIEREFGVCDA